jgi:hypothetical protein
MRRVFLFSLFLPLAACNGAPISTQWKLRDFNVGTADLAQLRVAMRGPDWVTPTPESAAIEVRYWRDGDDEARAHALALRLQRAAHPGDREALTALGGAPSLTIVELAPRGLGAARSAQQEAARLRAEGARTRGKIDFSGSFACRRDRLAAALRRLRRARGRAGPGRAGRGAPALPREGQKGLRARRPVMPLL